LPTASVRPPSIVPARVNEPSALAVLYDRVGPWKLALAACAFVAVVIFVAIATYG
jgi:hypothetical protein